METTEQGVDESRFAVGGCAFTEEEIIPLITLVDARVEGYFSRRGCRKHLLHYQLFILRFLALDLCPKPLASPSSPYSYSPHYPHRV